MNPLIEEEENLFIVQQCWLSMRFIGLPYLIRFTVVEVMLLSCTLHSRHMAQDGHPLLGQTTRCILQRQFSNMSEVNWSRSWTKPSSACSFTWWLEHVIPSEPLATWECWVQNNPCYDSGQSPRDLGSKTDRKGPAWPKRSLKGPGVPWEGPI